MTEVPTSSEKGGEAFVVDEEFAEKLADIYIESYSESYRAILHLNAVSLADVHKKMILKLKYIFLESVYSVLATKYAMDAMEKCRERYRPFEGETIQDYKKRVAEIRAEIDDLLASLHSEVARAKILPPYFDAWCEATLVRVMEIIATKTIAGIN